MGPTGSGKTSVGEETARFDSLAVNVAYANHQSFRLAFPTMRLRRHTGIR